MGEANNGEVFGVGWLVACGVFLMFVRGFFFVLSQMAMTATSIKVMGLRHFHQRQEL